MTARRQKQQAVKQSILLRRQRRVAAAIAKNGGPITQQQIDKWRYEAAWKEYMKQKKKQFQKGKINFVNLTRFQQVSEGVSLHGNRLHTTK